MCTTWLPGRPTCTDVPTGNKLSWTPPAVTSNIDHYEITIYSSDPYCCWNGGGSLPFVGLWTVYGTDTIVPTAYARCYSFTVTTICKDGMRVDCSEKKM
jgi:hypothetical protein